jgi:aspartyl-tRNA(Asn)/glutamyl-tRNA(Gln) amidotransferase subunit A
MPGIDEMPADEFMTLTEISGLIRARELSPVTLARTLISRIEQFDPQLHAFITPTFQIALDRARRAEHELAHGRCLGPFHGVPFALKDIYDTAGIRTTAGSRIYAERIPTEDAATVTRLLNAGGVLLGKLATHEFAIGGPSHDLPWPVPRNPWNTAHYVGGSSSGSAAAVAAGFVPAALGSDTGASIRNPAALAGITGLKPTFGLISRRGVIPNACSLDTCGPMARTAEDCAILLNLLVGFDAADPSSIPVEAQDYRAALTGDIRGLRIGVVRHFWERDAPVDAQLASAMDGAVSTLSSLGALCEEVQLRRLQDYHDIRMLIGQSEIFANHHANLSTRIGDFGAEFLRKVLPGMLWTSVEYIQAQRERRQMLEELRPVYAKFDALVTAGSGPAARLDQYDGRSFWSQPNIYNAFNVSAGPALAVGVGFSSGGLPLGMQIASAPFRDATVLRIGHAYQSATTWHSKSAPLKSAESVQAVDQAYEPVISLDATTRLAIDAAARRAGVTLDERSLSMIGSVAPYALATAGRLPRHRGLSLQPAAVFSFPR